MICWDICGIRLCCVILRVYGALFRIVGVTMRIVGFVFGMYGVVLSGGSIPILLGGPDILREGHNKR